MEKPNHVGLHIRTNDLQREKTLSQITKSITELAMPLIKDGNSVIVSCIVPRFDNLNNKVNKVNNRLVIMCGDRDIPFLPQNESINSSKHLNENKLHLSYI